MLRFLVEVAGKYSSKHKYWEIDPNSLCWSGSVLGQGTFATVKLVRLKGVTVAKKHFKAPLDDFETELEVLKKVNGHPNIVTFIGAKRVSDKEAFIIMEYCSMGTLTEYYQKASVSIGFAWALGFCKKLASAVLHLHMNGILHRDLKGMNVMLTEELEPKLIDFGVAYLPGKKFENRPIGSKTWMAPEVFTKFKCSQQSDIFSLGLIFHELCMRETPSRNYFHIASGTVPDISPHLAKFSPEFGALIYHYCCNPNPKYRPSAEILLNILTDLEREKIEQKHLQTRSSSPMTPTSSNDTQWSTQTTATADSPTFLR